MTAGTPPGNKFFLSLLTAGNSFLLVNRQLVTGNQVGKNSVMEDGEAEKSGTKENEREESDRFEDWNKMLRNTLIPHVKVANFSYKHPPTTSFYYLYTPR